MPDFSQNINWLVVIAAAVAAAVLFAGIIVVVIVNRVRRRQPAEIVPTLRMDVSHLPTDGPPAEGPRLKLYNVPVRLGVLVLAPVGRDGASPRPEELSEIVDQIVPGLGQLLAAHRTSIKIWPPQLSSQGFANKFFANVSLPGDHGRGSPWCSLAGRFDVAGRGLLAGVGLCADAPNSMGQYVVEHDAQWFDMLRITES